MSPKRKIFDITPPKIEEKNKKYFLERPFPVKKAEEKKGASNSFKRGFIFFVIFLFIVSASCYFFIEPKAEIKIWPKTESRTLKTQLEVVAGIEEPDFSGNVIPGKMLDTEISLSQAFLSANKVIKKEKAKGIIRVYNDYHLPVTLINGTRFMSDSGKQFRIQCKITIPAKGYIDTEVIADLAGEDYNIEPATFVVPNLRNFPPAQLYYDVYGKSSSSMTGGSRTEVFQISQEDLDRAREVLEKKTLEKAKASLSLQAKSPGEENLVLITEAVSRKLLEVIPLVKVGEETERFTVQAKAEAQTLVFSKTNLENFANNYLLSNEAIQNKAIQEESLEIKYSLGDISLEKEKMTLEMEIAVNVYSGINLNNLKKIVMEKTLAQISWVFSENYPDISKVEAEFWPFWVKKAPQDVENIEIKLNFGG